MSLEKISDFDRVALLNQTEQELIELKYHEILKKTHIIIGVTYHEKNT